MTEIFSEDGMVLKKKILQSVEAFPKGETIYGGERNTIKTFEFPDIKLNIKAFKKPNIFNKIAYRFFRKSKAQRSFEHAAFLLEKGIGTPKPLAYLQNDSGLFFGKSYYVCEHLEHDITYREIIHDPNFPNRNEILKQFTLFTHRLHENGIEFLDHSPGNTLIVISENNRYDFFLVDLNRMKFHEKMDHETRIKNFSKLTSDKNMVAVMSAEYAKLINGDYLQIFTEMWGLTEKFQQKYHRKRRLKKQFLFWRKK